MSTKERVQFFLERDDYEFARQVAKVLGTSASAVLRNWVETNIIFLRSAFGSDISKVDLRKLMAVTNYKVADVLTQVADFYKANKPEYCIQNNGDCKTCSLVNYDRDCRNNPVLS